MLAPAQERARAPALAIPLLDLAETWLAGQGDHDQAATPVQAEYILASRRGQTRRLRLAVVAVAGALLVMMALAAVALLERRRAVSNEETAVSRELAATATSLLPSDPELSNLLAIRAFEGKRTDQAQAALRRAVLATPLDILLTDRGEPTRVAISPSGRRMAAGTEDGTVRVWDARGERSPTLHRGDGSAVVALAFSPDGTRLASARFDGAVRVDHVAGAHEPLVLPTRPETISDLAYSAGGERLAGAGYGTVRVWRTDGRRGAPIDLRPARDAPFDQNAFSAVAFSPDGERVAAVRRDGTIHIWRSDGQGSAVVLRGPPSRPGPKATPSISRLSEIAFSSGGQRVRALDIRGVVRSWDADGGGRPTMVRGPADARPIGISRDGSKVASAGSDGALRIWSLAGPEEGTVLRGHRDDITSADFTGDGKRVLSGGTDQTVRLWDAEARPPTVLGGRDHFITWDLAISQNRTWVASSGDDPVVRLWRVAGDAEPRLLRGHRGEVRSVAFDGEGTRLASAGSDGTVRIWRLRDGQELEVLGGRPAGFLHDVAFNADGTRIASAGEDGLVRVRHARGPSEATLLRGHRRAVRTVTFSPDGAWVASAGDDGTVRLWSTEGGDSDVLGRFTGFAEDLMFSPTALAWG
jgi:WD40 repeat protein